MIRPPPRSTPLYASAASDVYKRQALYGFARFISDFMEQVRPERLGIAFDQSLRSETSIRSTIYPAYKANRESPPADLERQFPLCREFCRHMGLAEFASAA